MILWIPRLTGLIALFLCLQGRGSHSVFVGIFLAGPALALILSNDYRHDSSQRYLNCVAALKDLSGTGLNRASVKALLWIVFLPMVLLSLGNGVNIASMDYFPTILTASRIIEAGTNDLSPFLGSSEKVKAICDGKEKGPYWIRCIGSQKVVSAYPLGMLLPSLPFVGVAKILGGNITETKTLWRIAKFVSALLSGLILTLFSLIAFRLVQFKAASLGVLGLATGSTVLGINGQGLWTQTAGTISILVLLVMELFDLFREKTRWRILFASVFIAFSLASRLTNAAWILPIGVYWLSKKTRFGLLVPLASLLVFLPVGIWQHFEYGHFWGAQFAMATPNTPGASTAWIVTGLLFSPVCGFFVYQPWAWFSFAGLRKLTHQKVPRRIPLSLVAVMVGFVTLHIAIYSQWSEWWSGVWGSRYLTEATPVFMIFALFFIEGAMESKWQKRLVVGSIGLAMFIQVSGTYGKGNDWYYDPNLHPGGVTSTRRLFDWWPPVFLYPIWRRFDSTNAGVP